MERPPIDYSFLLQIVEFDEFCLNECLKYRSFLSTYFFVRIITRYATTCRYYTYPTHEREWTTWDAEQTDETDCFQNMTLLTY